MVNREILDLSSIFSVNIPSHIFKDRNLSVLESIVVFLKDNLNFNYSQIAKLLNRDDRTIWTVYNRSKKKIKKVIKKIKK